MKLGISTASFFKRMYNEESVKKLDEMGVKVTEVFLGTFSEYKPEFARLLKREKGALEVHSVHTLNTHFEPQLFTDSRRALDDAYAIADEVLTSAEILGAKNYTFHGQARIKRNVNYNNYGRLGEKYRVLTEKCAEHGVNLALENVCWAHCNDVGFYSNIKRYCPLLKATLDIKQAHESGRDYAEFLNEMGRDIVTVHISDMTPEGKVILPQKGGTVDFARLFKLLDGVGFDGAVLIEVYNESYGELDELTRSLEYVAEIKAKLNV